MIPSPNTALIVDPLLELNGKRWDHNIINMKTKLEYVYIYYTILLQVRMGYTNIQIIEPDINDHTCLDPWYTHQMAGGMPKCRTSAYCAVIIAVITLHRHWRLRAPYVIRICSSSVIELGWPELAWADAYS